MAPLAYFHPFTGQSVLLGALELYATARGSATLGRLEHDGEEMAALEWWGWAGWGWEGGHSAHLLYAGKSAPVVSGWRPS